MRTRVRPVAIVAVSLLLVTGIASAQGGAPVCTATLAAKTPVRLSNGGSVFVEPQAVVTSGDRILIAGNPTYVWYLENGRVSAVGRDSIFGIVTDRTGRATAIPSPLRPGHVHAVRAAAHDSGQWAVVFADADPPVRFAGPIHVRAYWFGITDGARWIRLEKLPAVEGELKVDAASSLVRTKRGYAFALPLTREYRDRAAVFAEREGRWTTDFVGAGALYTSLTTDGDELVLGSVYSDTAPTRPAVAWRDHNSLWLYRTTENGTRWGTRTRLVHGVGQPVHHPALAGAKDGVHVGWLSAGAASHEARLASIVAPDTLAFTAKLVRETQQIMSNVTANGRPLWVTTDYAAGPPEMWVRIWTMRGAAPVQLAATKTDFDGVAGFAVLDSTIVVVGPIRGVGPYDPGVTLRLHHFTMNCD